MSKEDGFYEINRFCTACRDSEWAKSHDNPKAKVEEDILLKYDVIEIVNLGAPNVKKYLDYDILPQLVVFVIPNEEDARKITKEVLSECRQFLTGKINFQVVQMFQDWDRGSCITSGMQKVNSQYVVIKDEDVKIEDNIIINALNKVINEDLEMILAVKYKKPSNFFITQSLIYKRLKSHGQGNFFNQLQTLEEQQGKRFTWTSDQILRRLQ